LARFWNLLRIAGAVVLLAGSLFFLARNLQQNWQLLISYEWQLDWSQLLLALLFLTAAFLLAIGGWHFISTRLGGSLGLARDAEIYCLTVLARRLPGPLWQVVGRVYLYERASVPRSVTLWGNFWEISAQELSGLLMSLLCLAFFSPRPEMPIVILAAATLLLGSVVLFPASLSRLLAILRRRSWTAPAAGVDRAATLGWVGLYSVGWFLGGLILVSLAHAVSSSASPDPLAVVGFVALSGAIGGLLFFLPADTGIREVSLSLLLSSYYPLPIAIAIALLFRAWVVLGEGVLALIMLLGLQACRLLIRK
jgi:glycosyltransferase 2 family protein